MSTDKHRAASESARRVLPATLAITIAALALALPVVDPARAGGSDLRAARAVYPAISGTVLDACALCHVGETDFRLDPYGADYERSGEDFAAIEGLDSDGDGFTNLEEIAALTFPGKAASRPTAAAAPTATAAPSEHVTHLPWARRGR